MPSSSLARSTSRRHETARPTSRRQANPPTWLGLRLGLGIGIEIGLGLGLGLGPGLGLGLGSG